MLSSLLNINFNGTLCVLKAKFVKTQSSRISVWQHNFVHPSDLCFEMSSRLYLQHHLSFLFLLPLTPSYSSRMSHHISQAATVKGQRAL